MSQLAELYAQSLLAFAAYANLDTGVPKVEILKRVGMTSDQATDFASNWTVVDQYSDASGVSATVFQENASGKRYLAIRGTVPTDPGDINADYILAMGFPSYLNPQFIQLKAQVSQWLDDDTLPSGFSVTGHSLGGYLAAAIGTWFSGQANGIYTYNAPGLGGLTGNVIDAFREAFGLSDTALVDGITNVRGSAGISLISGIGAQLAPPLFIQTESNLNPFANHSISGLTDALAVYNLFFRLDLTLAGLDPIAAIDFLEPVFKASSTNDNFTLETLINSLGRLFVGNGFEAIKSGTSSRDDMYSRIKQIVDNLPTSGTTLLSIAETSAGSLENLAKVTDAKGTACRYALQQLNPFIVVGADYSRFNQNGELDRIDPDTGTGSLSDSWITDRSAMLAWVIKANTEQGNDSEPDRITIRDDQLTGDGWLFDDRITGKTVHVRSQEQLLSDDKHKVVFGKESTDFIKGDLLSDRLYGGGGTETILGKDGGDYIEGGKGDDVITGGKGDDVSVGGEGKDTYFYTVGDGNDRIIDSGENTIIIDDGAGHKQTINKFFKTGTEVWTSIDGQIQLAHHSPWQMVLPDGGIIELGESFQDGDFGIHLLDAPTTPEPATTIAGDLTPFAALCTDYSDFNP